MLHIMADSGRVPLLCCGATARSSLWTPVLVDTGSYGYRVPLHKKLERLGLGAEDVTSVVLTHRHTRTRGKGGIN